MVQDGAFDRLERADELQDLARIALDEGDWQRARELAETVLTLDTSQATAPVRLILAWVLEHEGQYDAALYELRQYLALELPEAGIEKGRRLEVRLRSRLGARSRSRTGGGDILLRARRDRAAAVSLLVAGVAPIVVGVGFVINDVRWARLGVDSGSWAAIGTPLALGGIALDLAGLVLLVRGVRLGGRGAPRAAVGRRRPELRGFSVSYHGDRASLLLQGRW